MTSYFVTDSVSNPGGDTMTLAAGTWPIRLAQINVFGPPSAGWAFTAYRYESGTSTGGTVLPVSALRQGAPASTAVGRQGNLTPSGTQRLIGGTFLPPGNTWTYNGSTQINTYPGSSSQIQFPLTTTINPGSLLVLKGLFETITHGIGCTIYFEELRLSGSY